jgi:serine/threonine-protein kinase
MSETRVLGDRYELGEVIGRGGMAEVRRGRDSRLGRTVAVKMLRVDHASDPTFQARFRREAQSAASLNHRNIVAVYDSGEDLLAGQLVPYIVMEYVEGRTLRELIKDRARFTPERAIEITEGILEALEYSHRAGIVHRDIKPGNVMLNTAGEVKVMDFGIARSLADEGLTLTQTAAVVGTAQYISPEQARGEAADARSDLYAVGCVLYELLTGRPPFVGDSLVSVAVSHVREMPTPPSAHDPSIPPDLDAVVMKALAKDRLERYQSAQEMREDLRRIAAGIPVAAAASEATTALISPVAAAAPYDDATIMREEVAEEEPRGTPWGKLALGALAVLLLAGLIGYLAFRDDARTVRVPSLVDLTVAEAEQRLTDRGLELVIAEERETDEVEPGIVLEQDPAPNTELEEGESVDVVVSVGIDQVAVPSVVGRDLQEAQTLITEAGLVVGDITQQASSRPANEVLSTDPSGGTSVDPGTTVDITVSSAEVEVPDVSGLSQSEAETRLRNAGFEVQVDTQVTGDVPAGTVFGQEPDAGALLGQGETVLILVAEAPPPEPEPEPTTEPEPTPTQTTPTETPSPQEDGEGGDGGNGNGGGNGGGNG